MQQFYLHHESNWVRNNSSIPRKKPWSYFGPDPLEAFSSLFPYLFSRYFRKKFKYGALGLSKYRSTYLSVEGNSIFIVWHVCHQKMLREITLLSSIWAMKIFVRVKNFIIKNSMSIGYVLCLATHYTRG